VNPSFIARKLAFDAQVKVEEILDPELHPLLGSENDPNFEGILPPKKRGEHFGVTAKLNGVIGLGRTREFGIPNLIQPCFVQRKEVRETRESATAAMRLGR
jgi:hypothetical protein